MTEGKKKKNSEKDEVSVVVTVDHTAKGAGGTTPADPELLDEDGLHLCEPGYVRATESECVCVSAKLIYVHAP